MKCQCDMIQYAVKGISSLTLDAVDTVKKFLLSQLNDDGGFAGRDGKSDLYYTVFGIQLIHALSLQPPKKLTSYIESFTEGEDLDFIHQASLIRCLALLQFKNKQAKLSLIAQLEAYRSSDGGYNHLQKNAETGTAYAGFLAYLAYRESGLEIPEPQHLKLSIEKLKRQDGSYANDHDMNSGSTTATSAAMVLLHALGEKVEEKTVAALFARSYAEGGFFAGPESPVPDLLTTATSLYALRSGDVAMPELTFKHQDFISSLWNEDGGFSGQMFDDVSDCEYTFYALLALGLL